MHCLESPPPVAHDGHADRARWRGALYKFQTAHDELEGQPDRRGTVTGDAVLGFAVSALAIRSRPRSERRKWSPGPGMRQGVGLGPGDVGGKGNGVYRRDGWVLGGQLRHRRKAHH